MIRCREIVKGQNEIKIDPTTGTITCNNIIEDPRLNTLKFDKNTGNIYTDYVDKVSSTALLFPDVDPENPKTHINMLPQASLTLGFTVKDISGGDVWYSGFYNGASLYPCTFSSLEDIVNYEGKYFLSNNNDPLRKINSSSTLATYDFKDSNNTIYYIWRLDNTNIEGYSLEELNPSKGNLMRYSITELLFQYYKYYNITSGEEETLEERAIELLTAIVGMKNAFYLQENFEEETNNGKLLFFDLFDSGNPYTYDSVVFKPSKPVARIYVEGTTLKFKAQTIDNLVLSFLLAAGGSSNTAYSEKIKYCIGDFRYPKDYPSQDSTEWKDYAGDVDSTSEAIDLTEYLNEKGLFKKQILLMTERTITIGDGSLNTYSDILALPAGQESLMGDTLSLISEKSGSIGLCTIGKDEKDKITIHGTPAAGSYFTFGSIPASNTTYGGQPISWLVLDVDTENSRALVISEKILTTMKPYTAATSGNFSTYTYSWDNCDINTYLNGSFISEYGLDNVSMVSVEHETEYYTFADSNSSGTRGTNTKSSEKVFLLSVSEANSYFADNSARVAYDLAGSIAYWWLRSPGSYRCSSVADVGFFGYVSTDGSFVLYQHGLRPAFWINFKEESPLVCNPN